MNDFTPYWFASGKTNEIMYQDSCGDFMIPTKEQLVSILNNNEKQIANYLLMLKHQENLIKQLQKEHQEHPQIGSPSNEEGCNILKFPQR